MNIHAFLYTLTCGTFRLLDGRRRRTNIPSMLQRIYRLVEFLFKQFVRCHKKFGIFWPPLTEEEKLKRKGTALPKKPVKGGVIFA